MDLVETTKNSVTTVGFPIYDAHGNGVARLYRSGTGYAVSDRVAKDAWGVTRQQQSGADGRMAYCGSLGHQASEQGLVYMRARYYEPASGRFLSEDPARHGVNWFAYASSNPVHFADPAGTTPKQMGQVIGAQLCFMAAFYMLSSSSPTAWKTSGAIGLIVAGVYLSACASDGDPTRMYDGGGPAGPGALGGTKGWLIAATLSAVVGYVAALVQAEIPNMTKANGLLHTMSAELFAHNVVLFFYITAIDEGSVEGY